MAARLLTRRNLLAAAGVLGVSAVGGSSLALALVDSVVGDGDTREQGCRSAPPPPGPSEEPTPGATEPSIDIPAPGGGDPAALAAIPQDLIPIFQYYATASIPWTVLAATAYVESKFNPNARSPAGAGGLMQIMPGTAVALGITAAERFHPDKAVWAGARYLATQLEEFGSFELMWAAYNAGPSNVRRYGGVPPFPETQAYVVRCATQLALYGGGDGPGVCTGGGLTASAEEVMSLQGRLSDGAPLEIYDRGLADLFYMDERVLGLMLRITALFPGVYVSSLKTGHTQYVAGSCARGACSQSRHWTYNAMDLWKVGGEVVQRGAQGGAKQCWTWLKHLEEDDGRPRAVGSPWGTASEGGGSPAGHFTDGNHQDHFHIDFLPEG